MLIVTSLRYHMSPSISNSSSNKNTPPRLYISSKHQRSLHCTLSCPSSIISLALCSTTTISSWISAQGLSSCMPDTYTSSTNIPHLLLPPRISTSSSIIHQYPFPLSLANLHQCCHKTLLVLQCLITSQWFGTSIGKWTSCWYKYLVLTMFTQICFYLPACT